MGNARFDRKTSGTEAMANDNAMYINQPRISVERTATIIATGAAQAALDVSSAICTAESS